MSETLERELSPETISLLCRLQQNEITESAVYANLAKSARGEENKKVLLTLSADEKKHYEVWKGYTGIELKPQKSKVIYFRIVSFFFGFTFASTIMEGGEANAQIVYGKLAEEVPESVQIRADEKRHEQSLLGITNEERLQYIGNVMIGLNDALMELVALLAGFTFSIGDTKLAGVSGLIVTITAALSVSATEFLAARSQGHGNSYKAALYTGFAYLSAGAFLLLPYFLLPGTAYITAFVLMSIIAVLIIAVFSYFVSVIKGVSFWKRFGLMLVISAVVGAVAYLIAETAGEILGVHL